MEQVRRLVDSATTSGEFASVGRLLDRAELENPDLFELPAWPHVEHMLGHMYTFDLEDARFVFKRIPDQVRDSDEYIKAVFVILQHLWNSEYERVWHCLETTTWSEKGTLSMLNSFKLVLRQKVMDLVEQTYKDIEQIALASLLGVPVDEACKAAQERHWVVEDSTNLVVPKRREREDLGIEASGSLGGRELEKIVKYAIYLQSGQAPASLHSE